MRKGIFAVLLISFVYCVLNLFVVHEALIQIEHKEPLHIISENSSNIYTEQSENGFVTNIILPSGIFYKKVQLEIKSDIQQNAVIKFAGPKVAYKDTYKKFTIDYKKARVNDEEILSKLKTVSFLKPFSYSVDNLTSASIDFEYKTDFVLRNMSLVHFIVSILILLFPIGYILIFLYNIKSIRNTLSRAKIAFFECNEYVLSGFYTKDFLSFVINSYKNIRKEYKICFWVNFIVLNIVYLYLNMNFLYGNHDWPFLRGHIADQLWTGRYSVIIINYLTLQKYLPVVNIELTFIILSLTPIFLIKYWKLPVTKFNIFAVSVPLLLHPALLNVVYFLFLSYAYLSVPLLLIIALILSEKKNYKLSVLSICILLFAYGIYNVCINTLAVIFLGRILIEYANGEPYGNFIQMFKKYFRTIFIIC